jgi:glycosyltransferase involved in cell wall biosynthesis
MRMDRYRIAMRVAFLAFYFPPDGGPGTQRPASWVRHFRSFGLECTVFSRRIASEEARSRFEPRDDSLLPWIEGAEIERIDWEGGDPDRPNRWEEALVERLAAVHARRPFDLVLGTAPPYRMSAVTRRAAERLGLPYVIDLREPWALDGIRDFRSVFQQRKALQAMRESLAPASGIIVQTEVARRIVGDFLGGPRSMEVVFNGFEPEDFAVEPRPKEAGEFRIVFTGQFISREAVPPKGLRERLRRAMSVRTVSIQPTGRSPLHLLNAIRLLCRSEPAFGRSIRFHFVGHADPHTVELLDASGLGDAVVRYGHRPHRECAAITRSADALFLGLHGVSGDVPTMIIPGKAFEYLAAGRPILAAVPPGETRDLVLAHADAVAADPVDDASIARAITRIRDRDFDSRRPAGEALDRFTRRELARRTADFLRSIAGSRGSTMGP